MACLVAKWPPMTGAAKVFDVVVVGAGAGGMAAAAVAAAEGLSVAVVEKAAQVGGTTAWSGGMVWAPCNTLQTSTGHQDSTEKATSYLNDTVPEPAGKALRDVFIARAPEAIDYFQRHTVVQLRPVPIYPDYFPDSPGSTSGGRVLEPVPFDARTLGPHFKVLRAPLPEFMLLGGMMIARSDIMHFRKALTSWRSMLRVAHLVGRYGIQRVRNDRGSDLVLGNALVGRLLKSLVDRDVTILTSTSVKALEVVDGRVHGVRISSNGDEYVLNATRGVVLAAGGFSHNQSLRAALLPPIAGCLSATAPVSTGDGLMLGTGVGGKLATDNAHNAYWTPVSRHTRRDGSMAIYPHTVTDRAKPGVIAVDQTGRRFVNEAMPYHEFTKAMLGRHNQGQPLRTYLICDVKFLWTYGLGAVKPMTWPLTYAKRSGYLTEAQSIAELASKLSLDAKALELTLGDYNRGAAKGIDTAFGRGSNAYQRHLGDADHLPNPCVRPLDHPPFYAVEIFPGDLGTAVGLQTDAAARVLNAQGAPIAGLYACGNDMNSIMAGNYPGPGITLGPALVFGYLAALDMARRPQHLEIDQRHLTRAPNP